MRTGFRCRTCYPRVASNIFLACQRSEQVFRSLHGRRVAVEDRSEAKVMSEYERLCPPALSSRSQGSKKHVESSLSLLPRYGESFLFLSLLDSFFSSATQLLSPCLSQWIPLHLVSASLASAPHLRLADSLEERELPLEAPRSPCNLTADNVDHTKRVAYLYAIEGFSRSA